MNRTELSTIGKYPLIKKLTDKIKIRQASTFRGLSDDAVVLTPTTETKTLVTQKVFLEGIDFDLTYTPLKHLGYKIVVASISSIYSMNAHPKQFLLSIGVSARFSLEDIEELCSGVYLAIENYNIDMTSLDVTSSLTGLTISASVVGEGSDTRLTYRSGARPTDLICVTGDLGAAYMGLQLLEREKRVFSGEKGDFEPEFSGREYILERQLRPQARQYLIHKLENIGVKPSSMINVSDGLASELKHLAQESNVGLRIYEDRLPIDYETAAMAEEFNLNVTTVALNGGDDYELLFTIPLGLMDSIKNLDGVRIIGHVTEPNLGVALVARDGTELELIAQGWSRGGTDQ